MWRELALRRCGQITPGLTVFVTGGVSTLSIDTSPNEGTQDTLFAFNSGPTDGGPSSQGTIDISGVISGAGIVQYGTQQQSAAIPLGKVILRGNNTHTGLNILSRGNLVLAHNNALGTGAIRQDGPSAIGMTGYNIESTDDSRTIANEHADGANGRRSKARTRSRLPGLRTKPIRRAGST